MVKAVPGIQAGKARLCGVGAGLLATNHGGAQVGPLWRHSLRAGSLARSLTHPPCFSAAVLIKKIGCGDPMSLGILQGCGARSIGQGGPGALAPFHRGLSSS